MVQVYVVLNSGVYRIENTILILVAFFAIIVPIAAILISYQTKKYLDKRLSDFNEYLLKHYYDVID
jgi:hypothetical protein